MGNAPGDSRALVAAGMAAMLFLPLSDFLGLATSDETARIAGLTTAQIIYLGGLLAVLVSLAIEKFRIEHHARDRIYAVLFLNGLNPLFWGLFEQAGGSFNLSHDRSVDIGSVPGSGFQYIRPTFCLLSPSSFDARCPVSGTIRPAPQRP